MPASRKKTKHSKSYSTLINNEKKLSYFKSHLQTIVKSASVNGKDVRSGDCVVIDIIEDDSGTSTTDDVCIAQVQELRSDDSKDTETYALVRWFYTGPMLHRLSKPPPCIDDLSNRTFSPRELILSDHEQVFPLSQLLDKPVVRMFSESVPDQPIIGPGDWWYRYFWPTKQKTLMTAGRTKLPSLRCAMGRTCTKKGYTPHQEVQHYCPRDSCRRWYHGTCLSKHIFQPDPANAATSPLVHILRGTPGFDFIDLADDGPDIKFFERVKISEPFIKGIVACAQHGVMRGKNNGVVGNFNAVKRARELLVEARVHDLWPSDSEIKEFAKWKFPDGTQYRCKECKGAI